MYHTPPYYRIELTDLDIDCFSRIDPALGDDIRKATEMQVPEGNHLKFPLAGRNRGGIGG